MVATGLNRLPSFKSRRTLSLLENEPRERKSNPEKNLSSNREPSANSGLDIETKNLSATSRRRSFFVDIPFYRTTHLKLRWLPVVSLSLRPFIWHSERSSPLGRTNDSELDTMGHKIGHSPRKRRCDNLLTN